MSSEQLSKLWWFLASIALALLFLGLKDALGWMEKTKFFDTEQVREVISYWSLVTGGVCLIVANLVGSLSASRSEGKTFFARIPDWPLAALDKTNAKNEDQWDWKIFKFTGFFLSSIFPFILTMYHFLVIQKAQLYTKEGVATHRFFDLGAANFDDLRIGSPQGDDYIYIWTPAFALLIFGLILFSMILFCVKLVFSKRKSVISSSQA